MIKRSLDQTKIQTSNNDVRLQQQDLIANVIQPVIQMLEVEAKSQDLQISLFDNRRNTNDVMIDKIRTQQILMNLIRNSIKFS